MSNSQRRRVQGGSRQDRPNDSRDRDRWATASHDGSDGNDAAALAMNGGADMYALRDPSWQNARGMQMYNQPNIVVDSQGVQTNVRAIPEASRSTMLTVTSRLRNMDVYPLANKFRYVLEDPIRNVSQIVLRSAYIPMIDAPDVPSVFLRLTVEGRQLLDNYTTFGKTSSTNGAYKPASAAFDMAGAFGKLQAVGDGTGAPLRFESENAHPVVYRFFTPLDQLSQLDVELRVYPDRDPTTLQFTQPYQLLPMHADDEMEFDLEITASNLG